MSSHHLLVDGPDDAPLTLALAHGAGAPSASPWMARFARAVAAKGFRVARFDFPYMASGKRGAPDREPVLRKTWLEVIEQLGGGARLAIGGKSMGGRMASYVADGANVRGLVCLGYPFHPPGNKEKLRTAHLAELRTPTLIVQGSRDPFGTREDIAGYALSPAIRIHFIEGGDHSFKTPARVGTEAAAVEEAIGAVAEFLAGLT
jgi:predicted alpha/beta-hydrolase family hydrolase